MSNKLKFIVLSIFLFFLIPFIFSGCKTQYIELTKSDAGAPGSSWEQRPTGSAAYLDGDTVLVSIYLENADTNWTKTKKDLVKNNLKIACDFLKDEGERYGKSVNLIYDIDENPDLEYHYRTNSAFPSDMAPDESGETTPEVSLFYNEISAYIHSKIDVESILSAYGVNSIGFLVFIDNNADAALTYGYHINGDIKQYYETCFISLRWNKSDANVSPSTYAHEILHLFGARDLYCTNASDGTTKACIDYMYERYPDDIMLSSSQKGVDWHNRISGEISDITAYFLGWRDTIYETELFPNIEMQYKASFVYHETPEDFKSEYTPARRRSEKTFFSGLIYATLLFCILASDIGIIIYKEKRRLAQIGQPTLENDCQSEQNVP